MNYFKSMMLVVVICCLLMIYVQGGNGQTCDVCQYCGKVKVTETSITCDCPEGYEGKFCEKHTPLKGDCSNLWICYSDKRAAVRTKQKGIHKEEDCKRACVANVNCHTADYDFNDDSCYFGFSHATLQDGNNMRHWYLRRSTCPKSQCTHTWEFHPGKRVKDPEHKFLGGVTEQECKKACLLDYPKCARASYYIEKKECFMGLTPPQNNDILSLEEFKCANHWMLRRYCEEW
jgi:hypothetical protein